MVDGQTDKGNTNPPQIISAFVDLFLQKIKPKKDHKSEAPQDKDQEDISNNEIEDDINNY